MNIAVVAPLVAAITDPPLGGAQTMVADLCTGLSARGHQVDVYAATGSQVEGARVIATGIDAAMLSPTKFRGGFPQRPTQVARRAFETVYSAVRRGGYDAVHNHAFDVDAVRLAAGSAPTIVHTLHLPPDELVASALRAARRGSPPASLVAVSEAQASLWRATIPIDAVIRNGIPVNRIRWSTTAGTGIVFAGRLSPEKGAHEAIEIALVAGVEIDVYGDGYDPDYARRTIEPLARQAGVRVHRQLDREGLWRRMRGAAAVLCPALWEEPFGLVAAEAQATGTPVIAYRRGGLPEVILDGVTGFLVPAGDIHGAAAAFQAATRLSRVSCRRHAEAHLDLEPVLVRHEQLYQGLNGPQTDHPS